MAVAAGTIIDMVTTGCTQGKASEGHFACYVKLDHSDGYTTLYYHLAADSIPSSLYIGKTVAQGEILGAIGTTGDSTGTHLHFSIKYNGSGYSYTSELDGVEMEGIQFVDYVAGNYYESTNDGSSSATTSTTTTTHLMTVEPNSSGKFDIYGYEVTGSGEDTALSGNYFSYTNTGSTATILSWLSGDMNSDGWDDLVQVRIKPGYTYTNVYLSNGEGELNTQTRWKKTSGEAVKAFLDDVDGDGRADLILVFANTDGTLTWKYFLNDSDNGRFGDAVTWSTSFGTTSSVVLVGDFNGNGEAEAFAGSGSTLTWQRLSSSGSVTNISTGWALPTDEFVVADTNGDGSDEIIRIDERDSSVEIEAGHYNNSTSTFTIAVMGTDVGGTDGDYTIYPLDYLDAYADLIRSNGTTLYLARSNAGNSFEEQVDQSQLITGLSSTYGRPHILFGNFGVRTSTEVRSLNGMAIDPMDEDDTTSTSDTTDESDTSCDIDGDGQTATGCGGNDCNDSNTAIYYGAPEICGNGTDDDCVGGDVPCAELYCSDGMDNDLDGLVDCGDSDCASSSSCSTPTASDYDGDGYDDTVDCGWWSASIYPGAPELADWVDNDCDGSTDESCDYGCGGAYWDGCTDDYESYYSTGSLTYVCGSSAADSDGDGYDDSFDCAWWDATTYSGAPERGDWNDNNCDGTVDEGCDGSCSGYYAGGCHDDYEWWYLGTATSAPPC
ncbi:MAG: MopE-related protein [Patescibacteria group bacterium]